MPATSPNSWDQFWQNDVWGLSWVGSPYNGVIARGGLDPSTAKWLGNKVTMVGITDGTANTLLISEKQLNPQNYFTGDWHDDAGWGDGWDPDVIRYTGFQPNPDSKYNNQGGWEGYRFGSVHIGGMNALYADGSVRSIRYSVDLKVFNAIGGRYEGIVATAD